MKQSQEVFISSTIDVSVKPRHFRQNALPAAEDNSSAVAITTVEHTRFFHKSEISFTEDFRPAIPNHDLLRCIGRGSYGTVWLARNSLGRYRAVKIVRRKSFDDHKPFERELCGLRKFEPISREHEGFVHVLEVGMNEAEGYFFYAMELGDDQLSGRNIDPPNYFPRTLARGVSLHERLSVNECVELGLRLSDALAKLHECGLVHRDVKPSNIIFVNDVPKLADIGLVAGIDEARSYVGTAGFIPPEGPGSPQADIYSLGKVLYEALTGMDRHEFPGLPAQTAEFSDHEAFFELNEIILRACQNQPPQRYATARAMHTDLLMLTKGKSIKRQRKLRRQILRVQQTAAASIVVALLIGLTAYFAAKRHQEDWTWKRNQIVLDAALQQFNGAANRYRVTFSDSEVQVYDAIGHKKINELDIPGEIESAFFSQAGHYLAVTYFEDDDSMATSFYEVENWRKIPGDIRHTQHFCSACINGARNKVVTVDDGFKAVIWDISADRQAISPMKLEAPIKHAFFSADDKLLVAVLPSGAAQICESKTGKLWDPH